MTREHHYELALNWTGDLGRGTADARAYSRDHVIAHPRAGTIDGSSDPSFRGDPARWNPEQLFVAALSQCHMLWFLHLATTAGLVVTGYEDAPLGTMLESSDGSGRFSEVVLRPTVTISAGDPAVVDELHERVAEYCFIARSVNFAVRHEAALVVGERAVDEHAVAGC